MTSEEVLHPWKRRVADRFSAAAAGYDQAATSQRRIARGLAGVIAARCYPRPGLRVLEIGCGTGFLTAELLPLLGDGASWLATDIAPAMLEATQTCVAETLPVGVRLQTALMDGEAPTVAPGEWDLVCSSLAVQWFYDLRAGLCRLFDLLAPGGVLAITTLGRKSFSAWQAACVEESVPSFGSRYPSLSDLCQWFPDATISEHFQPIGDHACGVAFLAALRAIGADSPPPDDHGGPPVSAARLRRAVRRLAGGSGGDYHVLTILMEKPR